MFGMLRCGFLMFKFKNFQSVKKPEFRKLLSGYSQGQVYCEKTTKLFIAWSRNDGSKLLVFAKKIPATIPKITV